MGFLESSLMRQLGKLVEVVCHANEVLGDGYRLCVVSADHLAVQGGLTDVLRQRSRDSRRECSSPHPS